MRLVELEIGADVDEHGALLLVREKKAWLERRELNPLGQERATVERDDGLEVGRLRAEAGERVGDELVLVLDAERRIGLTLVPDRRRDLEVHPRPPHIEPPRCAGHTSQVCGSESSLS